EASSLAVVDLLLKTARPGVNDADNEGNAALHFAANAGNADIVRKLIKRGAIASPKNKVGKTALDLAREKKFEEIIKILEPLTANSAPNEPEPPAPAPEVPAPETPQDPAPGPSPVPPAKTESVVLPTGV